MLHICLDDSPRFTWIEMDEVSSTNDFLRHFTPRQRLGLTLVTANHQTAGRGQMGNTWESERGKNLLFSILHHPAGVEARDIFCLSEAVALGLLEGVAELMGEQASALSLKWPNDLYYGSHKMAGILIETELAGSRIERMVAGVGLNVNQTTFVSDAPNPISMAQVLGHDTMVRTVLEQVIAHTQKRLAQTTTDREALHRDYIAHLYRREGLHRYADADGTFYATISGIESDGHLLLTDSEARTRRYAFKEVTFV